MEEDKKKEEETIGDGLYCSKDYLQIFELNGERYRGSRWNSIVARRKRFNKMSEYMKKYFAKETTFVLPNEFLT